MLALCGITAHTVDLGGCSHYFVPFWPIQICTKRPFSKKYQPKLYINMKRVCLAIHPSYYLTETSFPFYNISLEKDGISKLGNKIVFKKGNRYTCNNTCKTLFMSMLSTSASF